MPIYSYKCQACEIRFDELVKMADRENTPCPECGVTAEQVITPVRFDVLAMGTDPDFATFGDAWVRLHDQQTRKEEKSVANHGEGEYGPAPGS